MNYYDSIAQGYDELHKEEQLNKLAIIKQTDIIKSTDSLLDVGCGTAFSLDYFDVKEAIGIDPAEKLVNQYSGNHSVMVGFAEKLPFDDDSFDVIISMTAIQNFSDIKNGLEEIKRVGRGKFALTYLKKSSKAKSIESYFKDVFDDFEILRYEEDKDIIFLITEKE